jgi:hypothetical protein
MTSSQLMTEIIMIYSGWELNYTSKYNGNHFQTSLVSLYHLEEDWKMSFLNRRMMLVGDTRNDWYSKVWNTL